MELTAVDFMGVTPTMTCRATAESRTSRRCCFYGCCEVALRFPKSVETLCIRTKQEAYPETRPCTSFVSASTQRAVVNVPRALWASDGKVDNRWAFRTPSR